MIAICQQLISSGGFGSGDPHYTAFDRVRYTVGDGDNQHYFLMRVTDEGNDIFYLQGYLLYTPWGATTTKSIAFGVPGSHGYQVRNCLCLSI